MAITPRPPAGREKELSLASNSTERTCDAETGLLKALTEYNSKINGPLPYFMPMFGFSTQVSDQ